MRRLTKLLFGFAVLAISIVSISMVRNSNNGVFAASTLSGVNEVITIKTSDGQPVNSSVTPLSYSSDGTVILFSSLATNLPNSGHFSITGPYLGLYIYNLTTDTTSRVDISTNGTLPNGKWVGVGGGDEEAALSENGRYITFASQATNLVDGSAHAVNSIYKRDTQAGTTSYVGVGYTGVDTVKRDRNLAVSNDGLFSLVSSRYLANGYPNNYGYAFGDGSTGTFSWTSIGQGSSSTSGVGDLSCDGAFAVIKQAYNVLLIDRRKSNISNITTGNNSSTSPIISCNGRYVLYATSNRTDITPTPTGMNSYLHLVRYDRVTGNRIYVDSNSSNIFSTATFSDNPTYYDVQSNVFNASIADTGDVVFNYRNSSGNYTYIKHLSDGSGTLEPIAKSLSGSYINVLGGKITSDGRYVFFQTDPYNLGIGSAAAGSQIIRAKTNL